MGGQGLGSRWVIAQGGEGARDGDFDTEESPKDPSYSATQVGAEVYSPCNALGMKNNTRALSRRATERRTRYTHTAPHVTK